MLLSGLRGLLAGCSGLLNVWDDKRARIDGENAAAMNSPADNGSRTIRHMKVRQRSAPPRHFFEVPPCCAPPPPLVGCFGGGDVGT